MNTKWLLLNEAAHYLGVAPKTLSYLVRTQKIKAYEIPGLRRRRLRFLADDLDIALNRGMVRL